MATFDNASYSLDKQIINQLFAVSDNRAALYAQFNNEENKTALIIHDFSLNQHLTLDFDLSTDSGLEVKRIFWQNSNTVGVFFSNRTVSLFDASSGKLQTTVSLDETSQEPISVAPLSEDTFAVLCRDSRIYEMSNEGFTGRSCRLDFTHEIENNIREADSSDAGKFEIKPSSDTNRVFAIWNGSQAWLIDNSRFVNRFRIDNFAAAPADRDIVFIADPTSNKAGYFPIYSTQQLLDAAKKYLSALGEE